MVRTGSLVTLNPPKVENHPVFSRLVGQKWKIKNIVGNRADVGGVLLPLNILVHVPQKKGKTAVGKAVTTC